MPARVASISQLYYFLAGVAAAIEFGEGDGRPAQPRHDVFPVDERTLAYPFGESRRHL